MGDVGNLVGPAFLLVGAFSALGALRTFRQRDEVEGAGSWGFVAFGFAALFLSVGVWITANYYARRDAQTVLPPKIEIRSIDVARESDGTVTIALAIENLSKGTPLLSVNLMLTALDCPTPAYEESCEARGVNDLWLPFEVAPGETVSGSLNRLFPLEGFVEGELIWRWALTQVNSQAPATSSR